MYPGLPVRCVWFEVTSNRQPFRPLSCRRPDNPRLSVFWKIKFKNGFQRMRLLCGGKEVAPIAPGRYPFELRDQRGRTVDTTYSGGYVYSPDAVSPSCGPVVVEIFSEKDQNTPISKIVDASTIERVWADFEPYRKAQAAQHPESKTN